MTAALSVGDTLDLFCRTVTRADLVRYAGASGDFNPIHWSDRVASEVGLPGVIAPGMLTMAIIGEAVTRWTGDPAALVSFEARFSDAVVVPDDDDGVELKIAGEVTAVLDGPLAVIEMTATAEGRAVVSRTQAVVQVSVGGA